MLKLQQHTSLGAARTTSAHRHHGKHRRAAVQGPNTHSRSASSGDLPVTPVQPLNIVVKTNLQPCTLRELTDMASLLAEVFSHPSTSPFARSVYGVRLVGTILCAQAQAGRNAGCMLALTSPAAGGSGADGELSGMVTVHMIALRDDAGRMAKALQLAPGTAVALVANLAVRAELRGQGTGRSLMAAVEGLVQQMFQPQPAALMLLVDNGNDHAVCLYRSLGFVECSEWVDPAWLEDAQKGRLGPSRRLLFVKKLQAAT